jgi:hypothetical protein
MSEEYNGYPTRETWSAALWMDSDEGMYDRVREMAREALANNCDPAAPADARYELVGALQSMWEEMAAPDFSDPDETVWWAANVYPMLSDIGSLWRVDWDFIADSILSE